MSMGQDDAVAIVGFGGVFPGSRRLEALLGEHRRRASTRPREVPPGRWLLDPARGVRPEGRPGRQGLRDHGADSSSDSGPTSMGWISTPRCVDRLDPVFHLALHAAAQAWNSARTGAIDRGARRRDLRQHRAAHRDVLGVLERDPGPGDRGERWALPDRRRRPTEPLNAFPAGLPAALVAQALGLGGHGVHARRRLRLVALRPQAGRRTSCARAGPTR